MSREIDIIQHLGKHLAHPENLVHDAFYEPQSRLIMTTDMLVEGRHFQLAYFSPQDLGWKAAAVNISDIAATGGRLKFLLVSLGLPDTADLAFVEGVYQGLNAAAKDYGGEIVGGDTVGADRVTLNITAIGELPPGHTPGRRHLAQPGDTIVTTGWHGLSRVGMEALQQGWPHFEQGRRHHLHPLPRIAEGLDCSARFQRYAMMDTSDGLADAALKIGLASKACLVLDARRVPLHPELQQYTAKTGGDALQTALYGGEDFELLACVPQTEGLPVAWQVLGHVEAVDSHQPPGAILDLGHRREALSLERTYQHFSEDSP